MIFLLRILCMVILGISLATANVTLSHWQFWVILAAVISYGLANHYEGFVKGRE